MIAHARLVVIGGDSHRLHQEIITAGGMLKEGRFTRMNVGQIAEALAAATDEEPSEATKQRFLELWDEITLSVQQGVIAPVPGIMRLFWAFSSSNPPESPSQEESSLANMLDTLEARCRSDGPPAGPRSIDPLPGSRSFLTVSAVA